MKTLKNLSAFVMLMCTMVLYSCQDDSLVQPNSSSAAARRGADDVRITLPTTITDYIAANYPGQSIIKAEKGLTKYEVTLSSGLKLNFDLEGKFLGAGTDDPMVALPKAITDYIASKYPGVTIIKAELSINKYEVRLSNGVRLDFSLNGTLIRVR